MSFSELEVAAPRALTISITDDSLVVDLVDGRTFLSLSRGIRGSSMGPGRNETSSGFIGDGGGIHWPRQDEDISADGILAGLPSGESQQSLQKWLQGRASLARTADSLCSIVSSDWTARPRRLPWRREIHPTCTESASLAAAELRGRVSGRNHRSSREWTTTRHRLAWKAQGSDQSRVGRSRRRG